VKILQINATYGIGSTGKYTKLLHENIKARGHDSYVITTVTDGSAEGDSNIFIPCGRVSKKISALQARVTGNQNNIAAQSTEDIIRFTERVKPDVIQLGNIHANFVNLKKLLDYIAEKDIALVVVLHDCWFFTGKCTNYIDAGCFRWKTKCYDCPKLKHDIPSWFFDKTESMHEEKKLLFDKIKKLTAVGVSERITEDASQSYVFGGRNCTCIPNAVDDTIFYAGEKSAQRDIRTVTGAAFEWSEYKGIEDFIKLGELCKAEFGDTVKIRLAGSCKKLLPKTKDRLEKAGVEMLGHMSQNELAEFYRQSDVFVSLSKGESFGCSISEAIMCGLPVVAYEGYAEKSVLSKYNYCRVVENTKNIEKIFENLKKVLNSRKRIDTKSGGESVNKPLCVAEYVEKFLKIYESF